MAATRRELLAGLGAGLVMMQGGTLAADGEAIAAAKQRWASVGDIQRLERMIREQGDRMQNALARVRRTGFGPSVLNAVMPMADVSSYPLTFQDGGTVLFAGSIIGLTIFSESAYSGVAGSNYIDFEVYKNGASTGITCRLAGGSQGATSATSEKGEVTVVSGDLLAVVATGHTGTPLPSTKNQSANIWVSFT